MFTVEKKLQTSSFYKRCVPVDNELKQVKANFDEQLKKNLKERKRFVVVCGPCSADDPRAMEEYLLCLKKIAGRFPQLLVVARVYTSKPHSNGMGYKGTAFHLKNNAPIDLDEGILRCRKMMVRCLQIGLPIADELLYPELYECFDDLVSYWFVGARSSEDSLHRDFASGLEVCCGIKNATDGNVEKAVDSLFAVSRPCVFPYNGAQYVTDGCKFAHIVLRGGLNDGNYESNLTAKQVRLAKELLQKNGLNDFVMADLNHANSGKIAANQMQNAELALNSGADGVMIESYLNSGVSDGCYGTSQTDDCLSIADTELLIEQINFEIEQRNK